MGDLQNFYRNWLALLPSLMEGYIYDAEKKLLPTRCLFLEFKTLLLRFLENRLDEFEKITILPGIRGIGKTTLLAQIYNVEKFLGTGDRGYLENLGRLSERLYLDVSRLKLEKIALKDFFRVYEEAREFHFEKMDRKTVLLLDEIHYDENWGLFLKNIFDRTKGHRNLLVIATGSSALNLKMNPDLSRRCTVREMYPLKFAEYLTLKCGPYPGENLSRELTDALFNSKTGQAVFASLKSLDKRVKRFFLEMPSNIEEEYFKIGGFPFSLRLENKWKTYELVRSVLSNTIVKDIIPLGRFRTEVLSKIYDLIYLLANSDVISFEKLLTTLKIGDYKTLSALVDTIITSGILMKVKALGKPYSRVRKTPKFLFTAPSLRAGVLDGVYEPGLPGKKIEDYFALVYLKDLKDRLAADISYDIAEGGADFVLALKDGSEIVLEVGFNKEEIKQVVYTQKKIRGKYGLVLGSRSLELAENNSVVKIPLEYLLLI